MKNGLKNLLLVLLVLALLGETFLLARMYTKREETETEEVSYEDEISLLFDEAIENRQIEVYYQPIVSCKDETVCGAEALSRWKVNGEYLSPSVFVSVLEATGQVVQLDEYVFETVCAFQSERVKQGKEIFPISVNLSVLSSLKEDIADHYRQICEDMGIEKGFVNLEITETIDSDPLMIEETVRQFQSCGFQVEIDDFGAGYSNYSALSKIGYDVGKLDKSLIDALENERGRIVVKRLIDLFKMLDMKIIAEGVENEEQVAYLKEYGCDAIQGYHYSKPLDEKAFISYIDSH